MTENHGAGAARAFLDALYATADDDLSILIWATPDKQSRWFGVRGREAICEKIQSIDGNVYVGAGLLAMPLGPHQRGTADQITGIPGVWADIDYGEEGHKKKSLPPRMLDAALLIADFPVPPTIVVHSGYGFQCWWLFHEFWRFDSDAERERAASLSHGWHHMLNGLARRRGWSMDSMFDLSRVMRLPGTWNVKREPKVPVTIDSLVDQRYGIEELEQLCPSVEDAATPVQVSLNGMADNPPFDKFQNLYTNDDEFKKLYEHRKKLPDDSISGYDMALANVVVRAGWSDEEIVGLLIAHRRKYSGEGPKHQGYYEKTIGKARSGLERLQVEIQLEELQENGSKPKRDEVLKVASHQLGVDVTGLIEITGSTPIYRLETSTGSIMLGTATTLTQQSRFRTKLVEVAGTLPAAVKERNWVRLINALLSIREQQSGGEENTELGVIDDWLRTYLYHSRAPMDWDEVEDAVEARTPFLSPSGEVCIYSNSLRKFLMEQSGERLTRNELAAMLRLAQCESRILSFTKRDGTRTSTSAWVLPTTPPIREVENISEKIFDTFN